MYHKTVLPNGLRSMIVDMPHMESVALGVWIGAGGRYENTQNTGISHYLEHMVFKGTRTRSTRDIKESIEGKGGSLNGFTDHETTCYYVKVPKKFIELGLDILSDMALNPKIAVKDLEMERGVIYEEIKMYKDRPDHYVHQLLAELLWPKHALGMPLVGTEETLAKMEKANLEAYRERFYTPSNMVVCVCGQVEEDSFTALVKKHFSRQEKKPLPGFKKYNAKQKKPRFNFYEKDTEQTHLSMGFHNISRFHPDKYTSKLLHIILGGNMSSRLFHEIREKRGLAYDISTSTRHYSDTGVFMIGAGIDHKKVPRTLEIISKELKKIKRLPVTEGELRRAKDFYKGQLSMGLEDTLSRMLWTGEKMISKEINYNIDEIIDSISMVTADMIRDLARKIFKEGNMNVAIISPMDKNELKSTTARLRV